MSLRENLSRLSPNEFFGKNARHVPNVPRITR